METDLQLAKAVKPYAKIPFEGRLQAVFAISPSVGTLCPVVSRKFGKTVIFSHSTLSILSTIYRSGKNLSSLTRVYNAHLQQRDQVASVLRTVGFWLSAGTFVCLLWLRNGLFQHFFLYTFTTLPASYSAGFVVLG